MNIKLTSKGNFNKTKSFLKNISYVPSFDTLYKVAEETITKLKNASPTDELKNGWSYEIERNKKHTALYFNNSVLTKNGENLAIIIDNGHVSKTGKWVPGFNYIEPIVDEAYKDIIKYTKEEINKL